MLKPPQPAAAAKPAEDVEAGTIPGSAKPAAAATAATAATATGAAGAAEVKVEPKKVEAEKAEVKPEAKAEPKKPELKKPEPKKPAQATPAAGYPEASPEESAQFAELEQSLEDGEVVEYEDDTISWPMMILQAIAAIVVGVGVFFGFSLIWAKAPTVLALVLAIAVTLLLVGLVHALLRHRDKLLMVLAAIVGLVLTFGPRLIQGL